MKKKIFIAILSLSLFFVSKSFAQEAAIHYEKARDAFRDAASKTKCPDRARVLNKYADWNQCMVDLLAGRGTGCPAITTPIPPCDGDRVGGGNSSGSTNSSASSANGTDELANSIAGFINAISEIANTKVDDNAKSKNWVLMSGGVNLDGTAGPIAGTNADIGHPAGYFFYFDILSRKGISLMTSFTYLKSNYFHSFTAKDLNGDYLHYVGRTHIQTYIVDLSLAKDFTGENGVFHFVPNVGADLLFGMNNDFTSTNPPGVTYQEDWNDKSLFFGLHVGVQMFYFLGKRVGFQGGGKYVFFPNENKGDVFKTGDFLHFNLGLVFRIG